MSEILEGRNLGEEGEGEGWTQKNGKLIDKVAYDYKVMIKNFSRFSIDFQVVSKFQNCEVE